MKIGFQVKKSQVQSPTTCCRDIKTNWNGRGWTTLRKPNPAGYQQDLQHMDSTHEFLHVWTINDVEVFVVFGHGMSQYDWNKEFCEWYFYTFITCTFICNLLRQCCFLLHWQVSKPPSPPIPVLDEVIGTYRHVPIMEGPIYPYILKHACM